MANVIFCQGDPCDSVMCMFKKPGFIEDNGGLKINPSLVTVVVHPQ